MSKLLFAVPVAGVALWFGKSIYDDRSRAAELADLRGAACDRMLIEGYMPGELRNVCRTNSEFYNKGVRLSLQRSAANYADHLNEKVEMLNRNLAHVDTTRFEEISPKEFRELYSPFAFFDEEGSENNRKLDLKVLPVEQMDFSYYPDPDYDAEPDVSFYGGYQAVDEYTSDRLSLTIAKRLYEQFDRLLGGLCFPISSVNGGCRGQVYTRAVEDDLSVEVHVVGVHLKPFTRQQALQLSVSRYSLYEKWDDGDLDATAAEFYRSRLQAYLELFGRSPAT